MHRTRAADLSARLAARPHGGDESLFEASFHSSPREPTTPADAAASVVADVLRLCDEGHDAECNSAPARLTLQQHQPSHAVGVGPAASLPLPASVAPAGAPRTTALDARWQALDVAVSAALLPRDAAPLGLHRPLAQLMMGGEEGCVPLRITVAEPRPLGPPARWARGGRSGCCARAS